MACAVQAAAEAAKEEAMEKVEREEVHVQASAGPEPEPAPPAQPNEAAADAKEKASTPNRLKKVIGKYMTCIRPRAND